MKNLTILLDQDLPEILREARSELRLDSPEERVPNLMEKIRAVFEEVFATSIVVRSIFSVGADVDRRTKRKLERALARKRKSSSLGPTPNTTAQRTFVMQGAASIGTLVTQTMARVERAVLRGIQSGSTLKTVMADIAKAPPSKNQIRQMARSQIARHQAAISRARQREAGVEKFRWVDSGDDRVRDEHAALNGQVFLWSSPPGEGFPGDPDGCRCIAVPVIE